MSDSTLETIPSKTFIEDYNPKDLIPTHNVRPVDLSGEFIESIRENGVAQPIITAPHPDGGYAIILGNRRTAGAIEAGRAVDIIVRHDLDAEATRIILQLVENLHREDMKASEVAAAYAQLALDLGLTDEEIAQRVAKDRKQVREAIALHSLPKAAKDAADSGALTIDDALAIQEFEQDPKVYQRLLKKVEEGGNLQYAVQTARHNKMKREEKAALRAELETTGVKIIGEPKEFNWGGSIEAGLARLADAEGNELTVESHASCPGHAAFISASTYAPAKVTYVCRDPKANGHTVEGSYRHQSAEELAAVEEARRKLEEQREALTVAAEVRAEYIAELCRSKKIPKGVMRYCLEALFRYGVSTDRGTEAVTLGYLGTREIGEDPNETFSRKAARFAEARQPLVLLAIVATKAEANMANHTRGSSWGCNDTFAIEWLEFLSGHGYTLAEPETELLDRLRERVAKRAAEAAELAAREDEDDEDDEEWDDEDEDSDEQDETEVTALDATDEDDGAPGESDAESDEAETVQVPDDLSELTELSS